MQPPIFKTCEASGAVTALLGTDPPRLYPFGEAPQGVALPYAVWQIITGSPENTLDSVPDIDSLTVQVDVYAATGISATAVATALRDAIEPVAHIVRWGGQSTDPETNHKRIGFDVDWFVTR